MDSQVLKNILNQHRKWILGEGDGERANLRYANLRYADLQGANLQGAYLQGADLRYADLRGAYLRDANLQGADLRDANLQGANLQGANLRYAYLQGANLQGANLQGADLQLIQDDFYKILAIAKNEVLGLYDSLIRGKVDGTAYEGECACLVGTIANLRDEEYLELKIDLKPDASRAAEKWFLAIQKGDTPENNPVSQITCEWMRQWMKQEAIQIPEYRLISSLDKPELFS